MPRIIGFAPQHTTTKTTLFATAISDDGPELYAVTTVKDRELAQCLVTALQEHLHSGDDLDFPDGLPEPVQRAVRAFLRDHPLEPLSNPLVLNYEAIHLSDHATGNRVIGAVAESEFGLRVSTWLPDFGPDGQEPRNGDLSFALLARPGVTTVPDGLIDDTYIVCEVTEMLKLLTDAAIGGVAARAHVLAPDDPDAHPHLVTWQVDFLADGRVSINVYDDESDEVDDDRVVDPFTLGTLQSLPASTWGFGENAAVDEEMVAYAIRSIAATLDGIGSEMDHHHPDGEIAAAVHAIGEHMAAVVDTILDSIDDAHGEPWSGVDTDEQALVVSMVLTLAEQDFNEDSHRFVGWRAVRAAFERVAYARHQPPDFAEAMEQQFTDLSPADALDQPADDGLVEGFDDDGSGSGYRQYCIDLASDRGVQLVDAAIRLGMGVTFGTWIGDQCSLHHHHDPEEPSDTGIAVYVHPHCAAPPFSSEDAHAKVFVEYYCVSTRRAMESLRDAYRRGYVATAYNAVNVDDSELRWLVQWFDVELPEDRPALPDDSDIARNFRRFVTAETGSLGRADELKALAPELFGYPETCSYQDAQAARGALAVAIERALDATNGDDEEWSLAVALLKSYGYTGKLTRDAVRTRLSRLQRGFTADSDWDGATSVGDAALIDWLVNWAYASIDASPGTIEYTAWEQRCLPTFLAFANRHI